MSLVALFRDRRTPYLVSAAVVAAVVVRVALVWDQLPPKMASHFGVSGKADGWMSKPGFFLFDVLVGGGVWALVTFAPGWMRAIPPEFVNVPNRDYWLAPERVDASLKKMAPWFRWLAVWTLLLFAAVAELCIRANLAAEPRLAVGVLPFLIGYLAPLGLWMLLFHRAFRIPPDALSR
jgi:eukaryotic-like serine/threonine-protein kinase